MKVFSFDSPSLYSQPCSASSSSSDVILDPVFEDIPFLGVSPSISSDLKESLRQKQELSVPFVENTHSSLDIFDGLEEEFERKEETTSSSSSNTYPEPLTNTLNAPKEYYPSLSSKKSKELLFEKTEKAPVFVGPYQILSMLGSGSFSKVAEGFDSSASEHVAIKMIPLETLESDENLRLKVIQEIIILKRLRNEPLIINLKSVIRTETHLCIVMECVKDGELFDYISRAEDVGLPLDELRRLSKQLVRILSVLHSHKVMHGDLKLENILLHRDGQNGFALKLIDFGFAKILKDGQKIKCRSGSEQYASPEIILGKEYNGYSADIWAFGVIFYVMLCGTMPFNEPARRMYHKICRAEFDPLPEHKTFPPHALDLIQKIFVPSESDRITLPEILDHPFFAE